MEVQEQDLPAYMAAAEPVLADRERQLLTSIKCMDKQHQLVAVVEPEETVVLVARLLVELEPMVGTEFLELQDVVADRALVAAVAEPVELPEDLVEPEALAAQDQMELS